MANLPFEARLSGQDADNHELPAYDAFNSLAGLSLATTIITHYAATGKIRRRGQFEARSNVRFKKVREGSLIIGMAIEFAASNPFVLATAGGVISASVYDLLKVVIQRNVGNQQDAETKAVKALTENRPGDIDALLAATEPSLRQAHSIIGVGATKMEIIGRKHSEISVFDEATKAYIKESFVDNGVSENDFSVAAFNANTGYGRVYDAELGHTVAIHVPEEFLPKLKAVIGWGLLQYSRGNGRKVSLKYTRILAADDRPKKYIIIAGEIPES